MTNFMLLFLLLRLLLMDIARAQEETLPEYVVSECYGDIFSFDCGKGHKIRIDRDFFGYSHGDKCHYHRGDCIMSNPKSNSLIHRYCTGRVECTYYLVERRGCDGYYSNYQQVEYQCVPDSMITNICSNVEYETTSTYIATPNFPGNYPGQQHCNCVVTSTSPDERVRMEIVYMAVKFHNPCKDWLKIGRRKICGTRIDLYSGRRIPIEFHSDTMDSHSGFWLHFQASKPDSKINVRCGDKINATSPFPRKNNRAHFLRRPNGSKKTSRTTTSTSTTSTSTTPVTTSITTTTTSTTITSSPLTIPAEIGTRQSSTNRPENIPSLLPGLVSSSNDMNISSTNQPIFPSVKLNSPSDRNNPRKDSKSLPIPKEWLGTFTDRNSAGDGSNTDISQELFKLNNKTDNSDLSEDDNKEETKDIVHAMGDMIVPHQSKTSKNRNPGSTVSIKKAGDNFDNDVPLVNPTQETLYESDILTMDVAQELTDWWTNVGTDQSSTAQSPLKVTTKAGEDVSEVVDTDKGSTSAREETLPWIEGLVESTIDDLIKDAEKVSGVGKDETDSFVTRQQEPEKTNVQSLPLSPFMPEGSFGSSTKTEVSIEESEDQDHKEERKQKTHDIDTSSENRNSFTISKETRDSSKPHEYSGAIDLHHMRPGKRKHRKHHGHSGTSEQEISSETNKKENTTIINDRVVVLENPILSKDNLLSLGLIIMCIAVVVGILFLAIAVLAICLKRRNRGMCSEETQTPGVSRSSVASGESDQGSSTGLLVSSPHRKRSYPRGLKAHAAACSVVSDVAYPIDQRQSKCRAKRDKACQINTESCLMESCESDDTYLMPVHIWFTRAEHADSVGNPCTNNKGVQTRASHLRGESKPRTQLKRRKVFRKVYRDGSSSSDFRSSCLSDENDYPDCAKSNERVETSEARPQVPPKPSAPKPKRNVWSVPTLPSQQPDSPETPTHRGSIASLSELSEVTMSPQETTKNSPNMSQTPPSSADEKSEDVIFVLENSGSEESDWETKSAISL